MPIMCFAFWPADEFQIFLFCFSTWDMQGNIVYYVSKICLEDVVKRGFGFEKPCFVDLRTSDISQSLEAMGVTEFEL